MNRGAVWVLGLGACLGCDNHRFVPAPTLDPQVAFVAAIALSPSSEILASTGLLPADDQARLELSIHADRYQVVVLGFDASVAPPSGVDRAGGLTLAEPCEKRLVPRSVQRVAGDLNGPDFPVPPLTAAWLDRCPSDLASRLNVDVRCPSSPCPVTVTQVGCALHLETRCGLGSFDGRAYDVGLCLEHDTKSCHPIEALGADHALACEGISQCEFRFYLHPAVDWAKVDRAPILPGVPALDPPSATHPTSPTIWALETGYVQGLALSTDGLVVVGSTTVRDNYLCSDPAPSRWVEIDPGDLHIQRSATTAPCLRQLQRIPDQDTMLGIFGAGSAFAGRFDGHGRLLASAPLRGPLGALPNAPRAMVYLPSAHAFIAAMSANGDARAASLVAIDPTTLSAVPFSSEGDRFFTALATDGEQLGAFDDVGDVLWWFGPSGQVLHQAQLIPGSSISATALFFHDRSGRWLLAAPVDEPFIWSFHGTAAPVLSAAFDGAYQPLSIFGGAADPNMLWVGTAAQVDGLWQASIHRYRPDREGFLPGAIPVGPGIIGPTLLDGETLWALLPWSAELLRIRSN
ncbi:MAG: hypothetical protein U1E65_13150 [Myxococcota bacterium]